MALPRKLKNFNLFNNGNNYLGQIAEITLPKLSRKMEEWRGGGIMLDALKQFGITSAIGCLLRFAGAYQRDDTGTTDAVEVVVRGRHKEIDFGAAKPADNTQHKFTTSCAYYKLTVNGEVLIEIDPLNFIFNVGGIDRLAGQRRALGV
jgi:P2 family phage contractile tail tube protein